MSIAIWGEELAAWVAAARLAEVGHQVVVTRAEPEDSSLRNEPGLLDSLRASLQAGRIEVAAPPQALQASIHWIAMSPSAHSDAAQLMRELAVSAPSQALIVNQSNFGIGCGDQLQTLLAHEQVLISIPDMLQQGQAMQQFKAPTTLIIGCDDFERHLQIQSLIRPFSSELEQIQWMSRREAEFTKFAISGMLALRLGYINELANLADQMEVDIETVRMGMASDKRIGRHYLAPGCGFGGRHLTQYIEGLADILEQQRHSSLLSTVLTENERQKELPFRKLWQHYACNIKERTFTLWGASFKPGVASIDNAPSLRVIDALRAQGARVQVHDPEALNALQQRYGNQDCIRLCEDPYQALEQSEGLLLLTEWPEYSAPDFEQMLKTMRTPVVIDGRNLFEPKYMRELGFTYYGIGRT